jgi:LysR family transcriptional regulator, carnitine catabolism transcriptional activator
MELRQLEYVVAVADHGTFTRAARALHVAQPSLSHGVRTLESALGFDVFERLGRSVAPTSAGREVIDAARRVLREMAALGAVAAAAGHLESGTLDLVALPTLAVDPLAALIGAFRVRHPGIVIRVHEPEDDAGLEQSLRSGRAELGFSDLTASAAGFVSVDLFRQEIVAVSPPGTVGDGTVLAARDLAQLPLVVTPVGTSTRRLLDRALARAGVEPNIAVEINHREAIVPLVLCGAGTTLLPLSAARDAAARGAVVRPVRPVLARRVGVLHRHGRLSPPAAAMVALARAAHPSIG